MMTLIERAKIAADGAGGNITYPSRSAANQVRQIIRDLLQVLDGSPLVCFGCAHSIGNASYPGAPSGERPCYFCVRNPDQAQQLADVQRHSPKFISPRYDNVPVKTIPADQYISTDRLTRDVPADAHIIT